MASSSPRGSRQRHAHRDRSVGAAKSDSESGSPTDEQPSPDRVAAFAFVAHSHEEGAQSASRTSLLLQEESVGDAAAAVRPARPPRFRATIPASHHSNTCTSCGVRLLWVVVVLHSLLLGALLTERTCTVELGTADWPWVTAACTPTHHDQQQRIAALEAALVTVQQQLADHGNSATHGDRSVEQAPTAGPSARTLLLWADDRTTRLESVRSFVRFVETELASATDRPTAVVTLDKSALSAKGSDGGDSAGLSVSPLPIAAEHMSMGGPCLLLFLHSAVSNKVTDLFDKHSYIQLQSQTTEACPVVFVVLRQLSENSGESSIEPLNLDSGAAGRELFLEFRHRHHTFYTSVQDSWNKRQLQRLHDEWDQQERKITTAQER